MYQVFDIQTRSVVSTHANLRAARRRADRLDNAYGAVRYVVRRAPEGQS